ncbi:hypothetical protein K457DRAFT_35060 [Linnemannia elongata AG-77]|uniref:Cupredoxin n=1 Tax=Linnemannia elongata AG-77 TaxID=1314771 RepID=A0A197JKU9_9FUNG|nr:hypothetical protein K457DRAFT_35060 [Linnemannia elongata AG-77]
MRFDITALALVAFIAPSVLATTWEVNFANFQFSPQELDVAPGDTVKWSNSDSADRAIVETNTGARTCNSRTGGFNSGPMMKGHFYSRVFPTAGVVNYKDGIGANSTTTASLTAQPVITPSPTNKPNSAYGFSASENALFLGAACFFDALVGF